MRFYEHEPPYFQEYFQKVEGGRRYVENKIFQLGYQVLERTWNTTHQLSVEERENPLIAARLYGSYTFAREGRGEDYLDYVFSHPSSKRIMDSYVTDLFTQAESDNKRDVQQNIAGFFKNMATGSEHSFYEFIMQQYNTFEGNRVIGDVLSTLGLGDPQKTSIIKFQREIHDPKALYMHIFRVSMEQYNMRTLFQEEVDALRNGKPPSFVYYGKPIVPLHEITTIRGVSALIPRLRKTLASVGFTKEAGVQFETYNIDQEIENMQGSQNIEYQGDVPLVELTRTALANTFETTFALKNFLKQGVLPEIGVMQMPSQVIFPQRKQV